MNQLSRRELLRLSSFSLASGLVLAACGKQSGVIDDGAIARLGDTPSTTALPEAEITDEVLLRTAASLEYNAIDTYTAALDLGVLPAVLPPQLTSQNAFAMTTKHTLTPLMV